MQNKVILRKIKILLTKNKITLILMDLFIRKNLVKKFFEVIKWILIK